MKKQSTNLFAAIAKSTLAGLTNEVKETLAEGFSQQPKKVFTAADLWNIQRQRKSMLQRRFAL